MVYIDNYIIFVDNYIISDNDKTIDLFFCLGKQKFPNPISKKQRLWNYLV